MCISIYVVCECGLAYITSYCISDDRCWFSHSCSINCSSWNSSTDCHSRHHRQVLCYFQSSDSGRSFWLLRHGDRQWTGVLRLRDRPIQVRLFDRHVFSDVVGWRIEVSHSLILEQCIYYIECGRHILRQESDRRSLRSGIRL